MAFCPNCGSQLNEGARFCAACGSPVAAPAPVAEPAPAPAEPVYQAPAEPVYQAPAEPAPAPAPAEPVYQAPAEPVYQTPAEPVYQAPQPQYQAPQPQYQAPQPQYQAPQPQYQAPQPQYQAPQPQYQAPQPQYQAISQPDSMINSVFGKAIAACIMAFFPITSIIAIFFGSSVLKVWKEASDMATAAGIRLAGKAIPTRILGMVGKIGGIVCTAIYGITIFASIMAEL